MWRSIRANHLREALFGIMHNITDIATYLKTLAPELGARILESYPPLYAVDDAPSLLIGKLLRSPYPAQMTLRRSTKRSQFLTDQRLQARAGESESLVIW
jgi:hypothetical protein